MKEEECKLPIPVEHRVFLKKEKGTFYSGSKKVAIVAAFLLLLAMTLMTVFTFQSISGIGELKQEVENLKSTIQILQGKIDILEARNQPKNTSNLLEEDDSNGSDDLDDDINYEYQDYQVEDYDDDYADDTEFESIYPEGYTKDAKTTEAAFRLKRSIIGSSTELKLSKYDLDEHHTTPAPKIVRSRRVHVNSDENVNYIRRGVKTSNLKAGDSYNSEENPDVEFSVVPDDYLGRTRHRQRRLEHLGTGRMRPLPAAHFSGDTSKYVYGQHDNFNGNGHLRHPQRTFVDWTESSWFHNLGMDRHFSLHDGILTIKEPGLYFIYAQIYYYDEHDMNGFRVYRNETETLLQCTTMTHSAEKIMKGNTCFTAGMEFLNENDKISVGDVIESRYSLFEPGKSFFGVIKLGDAKMR